MIQAFGRNKKKNDLVQVNLTPVLDMITVVIFFLLFTASFNTLTQHSVPPVMQKQVEAHDLHKPLYSILIVSIDSNGKYSLRLAWDGGEPGELAAIAHIDAGRKSFRPLVEESKKVVELFKNSYPQVDFIKVGLSSEMNYQDLISVMDGVRSVIKNIVLVSYMDLASGDLKNAK